MFDLDGDGHVDWEEFCDAIDHSRLKVSRRRPTAQHFPITGNVSALDWFHERRRMASA